jgi:capsular exopolysaccharide synthesis family protein
MYTATALLQIKSAENHLLFVTADQERGHGGASAFDSFKRTQRLMLRTRHVIDRALAPPDHEDLLKLPIMRREAPEQAAWLEKNLSVTFPEDSEMMYVSLSADDPIGLHNIVNSIVDEYYDEVVTSERRRKLDRRKYLEDACREADNELRKKRHELMKLVDRTNHTEKGALTPGQQNVLLQFQSFNQQLMTAQFQLMQEELELKHREEIQKKPDDEIEISAGELAAAHQADPEVRRLEAEAVSIASHIEHTKDRLNTDRASEIVKEWTKKLEVNTTRLANRKETVRSQLADRIRIAASTEIEQLRKQTALHKMQFEELEKKAKVLDGEANKVGKSSIDVEMAQYEIKTYEILAANLRAEFGRTDVELQSTTKQSEPGGGDSWARIKIVSKALQARPADSKTRLTTTIGIGGMSFLLPFALFVFFDASKNRISTGAEVTQAVGLSVIGAVPILPQRVMRRLNGPSENDKYWRTLLSESVDSIAAVLLKGTQPGASRVIMVSSANAGEGKTTLAAHLAVSLAGAGRHPVLVDFDLRRPALHRVFGVSLHPGVNEILRDGHELESTLQATQIPNLMMLSAGRSSKLGLGGLVASDLQSLFSRLRSEFDFVVVDACPILPVVDTRLIGQHVDAVLLSVLRDVSRAPKLRAACDLLDMFGIPMLGVVVTGSSEELYKNDRYEPLSEAQAV